MKLHFRKFAVLLGAALFGSAVTFGVCLAFQLYIFQTDFHKAIKTYRMISNGYYKPVPANELVDGAIHGMLQTLGDAYTEYLNSEEVAEFNESFLGEFEGIGADIRVEQGRIVVIAPVHDSPASKAGLLPGDIILEADGHRLDGLSLDEAAQYIRGPKGSTVSLLIRRSGIDHDFLVTVQRDTIPTETVKFTLLDDIALIKITEFSNSTGDEFEQAIRNAEEHNVKGIILDLRQNSGGMLAAAVQIASHFMDAGEPVVTLEYRDKPATRYVSKPTSVYRLPVVALIDEGSASAAEVLAGALRDAAQIPLVGRKTFGKGIAQKVIYFQDGSMLKYTHSELITPKGFRYHDIGLTPDVDVSMPLYTRYPILQVNQTYKLGDRSEQIGLAQKYLEALSFDPGRTDGVFDERTMIAIQQMQTKANLEPNGKLDALSTTAMVDMLRQLVKENDTQLKKAVEVLKERIEP
jgi:carboxyl-terminal processing protease